MLSVNSGEIYVCLHNSSNSSYFIHTSGEIAQLIITRIVIPEFIKLIDDDGDGDNKENKNITINDGDGGGFGSTGR